MTYSVQNTDGSKTITVAASQVNSSFSVALVGRNVSGYGQYFVQNSIRHLENFASTSAPNDDQLLTGQMWYDKSEEVMRVYDGTGWRRMSITVSATAPSGGVDEGTAYFDTNEDKLKIHTGSGWVDASYAGQITNAYQSNINIGQPVAYGSRVRTMFMPDTNGAYRAVLALMYAHSSEGATDGETVMAVFSDHTQFDMSSTLPVKVEGLGDVSLYNEFNDSVDGIGITIKPGMNVRKKYASTAVSLANVATQADRANAIWTGTANIAGAKVFHEASTELIPDTTDVVDMGNTTNRFGDLYINDVVLGNPTSSTAKYIKKASATVTLDIGEQTAPVDNLYVDTITLADGGGIVGLNVDTFGSSSALIDEVWAEEIFLDGTGNLKIDSNGVYGLTIYDAGGNVLVSPASGQAVTITGNEQIDGEKTFNAHIFAATTGTYNIGTSSNRFNNIYGTTLNMASDITTTGGDITASGTVTGGTLTDGTATLSSGELTGGSNITISGRLTAGTGPVNTHWLDSNGLAINNGYVSITSGDITLTAGNIYALHGNVDADYFNGTATSAQYADLAEIYAADADYVPGTVVKIGGAEEITQTTSHADTEVFGVISTQPAYLMNSDASGLPVALQGRVPVKVIGKVKKGERLVSSDVPGVAWGVADEDVSVQAIIGRSLVDKNTGEEGIIEAVIGVK